MQQNIVAFVSVRRNELANVPITVQIPKERPERFLQRGLGLGLSSCFALRRCLQLKNVFSIWHDHEVLRSWIARYGLELSSEAANAGVVLKAMVAEA